MVTVDLEHLSVETVDPTPTKAGLLLSPTGNHGVKRDGDNLVLVDIARGREQRLTDDGEPYFSYGKMPDASLQYIPLKKSGAVLPPFGAAFSPDRSEEHTSELQSLMRNSYAVFCLKKKKTTSV